MDDELLIAYFKGEVSDEETQRITEWIEAEIEHQRYYQQLCRLFEMSYWIEDMPKNSGPRLHPEYPLEKNSRWSIGLSQAALGRSL